MIEDKWVTNVKPRPEPPASCARLRPTPVTVSSGGLDGFRTREFHTMAMTDSIQAASELAVYFPLEAPQPSREQPRERRPHRLPPDVWPEIQLRAESDSLPQLAAEYGSPMKLSGASST
jgi:hypothetical protein